MIDGKAGDLIAVDAWDSRLCSLAVDLDGNVCIVLSIGETIDVIHRFTKVEAIDFGKSVIKAAGTDPIGEDMD